MTKKKYRVLWTEVAVRDLEQIVSYIAADSPANAEQVLSRIQKQAASLETLPLRGRLVPELTGSGIRTWRELIARPYRIIFRVEANKVYVLALLDSRRDLEDVLLERMVRLDLTKDL
jgi:plasmid stabilization system protein ParE